MSQDMQLLRGHDYPQASRIPNGCSRCLAARRVMDGEVDGKEPILDLGIDVDMEGSAYLCFSCFTELKKIVDDVFPDTRVADAHAARRRDGQMIRSLRDQLAAVLAGSSAQSDQIEALRAEINALRKK